MNPTCRPRVLVVDDEDNVRFLVGSALDLAGFATDLAEAGQAALSAVESFRPDLVVLDVMLPDIDGFTVLQRPRDRGPGPKVIFLTGRDATRAPGARSHHRRRRLSGQAVRRARARRSGAAPARAGGLELHPCEA